jgi:serine/threonine protein kinase
MRASPVAAGDLPTALTTVSSPVGTITYMSPEQVKGKKLDARSDLFSLGAVLYEMATGVPTFRGNSTAEIYQAILNQSPTPPVRLNSDIPIPLEEIIAKLLEKDPGLRYQHAADVRRDLQRLRRSINSQAAVPALEVQPEPPLLDGLNRFVSLWNRVLNVVPEIPPGKILDRLCCFITASHCVRTGRAIHNNRPLSSTYMRYCAASWCRNNHLDFFFVIQTSNGKF